MTKAQYLAFVCQEQRRCDDAFFNKQIIPIPWHRLTYETLEEDKKEHELLYKFNQYQRQYWANIIKGQGLLNIYSDPNILAVDYLIWYGKIYLPSFKCNLNNLPQLDSFSMHKALSGGYLTMIAGNLQYYAVNVIENASEKQRCSLTDLQITNPDIRQELWGKEENR